MTLSAPSQEVTVKGYLAHNLGDDLFMDTLFRRYPDVRFTVVADEPYRFFESRYGNVRLIPLGTAIPRRPLLGLMSRIGGVTVSPEVRLLLEDVHRTRNLVMIGGSMYQQQRDEQLQKQILFETRHLYKTPDHTFVIGANFGPYWAEDYREAYRHIFTQYCDDVCFRDKWSKSQFPDVANIRTASDVLFAFPMPKLKKRKQAFFSVCDLSLPGRPESLRSKADEYEQWIADIAEKLHAKGYSIVFGAFCTPENDGAAIGRIQEMLRARGVNSENIIYQYDQDPMVNAIASSEIVVATRFHATILGLIAGSKVLPLIYNVKTDNMLNDIARNGIRRVDLLNDMPKNWPHDADEIIGLQPIDVSKQQRDAELQFKALDDFLGR
ncbi:hypothetical protein GFD17_01040 [Bifidobacterium sp. SMB2]|uniref:Polysaccharide pyruvyl transferase domain-containing protein n=1 Tax=Bifidobacterium saimiriisciurei TaxID=2661627 RepID=A0ABX0C8I6_9BIFI|nr:MULTISPECIES: polysaccharide pyruvyl transferase family protein [Bifidobacterium]NEG95363.1 hypothetical protein [Bifidobacterium sp. SMB2]NEH11453.1 hypothetical protein [Bifidobacterium saimiriisciurei]